MKAVLWVLVGAVLIGLVSHYMLHMPPRQIGQAIGVYLIPFAIFAMRKQKQN